MRTRRILGGIRAAIAAGLSVSFLILGAASANAGTAARTRPGGGGGGGGGSVARPPSSGGSHPSPHGSTAVSGRATYGYGQGSGYYYGGSPWYPYYYGSPYWYGYGGYGWGWGWDWWLAPQFSSGVWWPPAGYGTELVTASGERRDIPGVIETDVRPKKATVRLDGEEIGRAKDYNGSWDRLVVAPGRHVLEFSAAGYQTLQTAIRVEPGRSYHIDQELHEGEGIDPRSATASAAAPEVAEAEAHAPEGSGSAPVLRKGYLKIAAEPPDAAVYLDGEFLASARELAALHGSIPVAQGEHEVEIIHPKYASRSLRVAVSGEDPVHVDLRLGAAPGE